MGGEYIVWRWEEGCVRKGCELCTCGLGRGVHADEVERKVGCY